MGANEHRCLLHLFRVGRFDDVRNPLAKKDDLDTAARLVQRDFHASHFTLWILDWEGDSICPTI
jgi:hypothetical protein